MVGKYISKKTNKMMKYFVFVLFILLSGCMNSSKQSFVIEGKFDFPNESIPISTVNLDLISLENIDTIKTDEDGNFKLSFDVDEPAITYLRLPNGTPLGIFMESRKKVQIYQRDGKIKFGESNQLHQLSRKISYEYYYLKKEFSSEVQITYYYDSLLNSQLDRLEVLQETGSDNLVDYIKYTAIGYNYSKRIRNLLKIDSVPITSDGYKFLDDVTFSDKNVLLSKEYINMQIRSLPSILKRQGKEISSESSYMYISQQINDARYRKYAQSMFLLFNYSSLSKTSRASMLNRFKNNYADQIPSPIAGMFKLMPGNTLFDFELENDSSRTVRLSDYKDKMILIDFWATWCAPCIKEEPFIFELARKYPSEIVVLSLNIDEAKEKWLEHIAKLESLPNIMHFNIKGGQGSTFAQQFFLSGVPRYILLGSKNKIIDAFAPKPSSEAVIKHIQENLK